MKRGELQKQATILLLFLERFSFYKLLVLLLGCAELHVPFSFHDGPTEPSEDLLLRTKLGYSEFLAKLSESLQAVLLIVLMTTKSE